MKYLFLCIYLLLALASYSTWKMLPTSQYQGTTIYWVTDPNPARDEQIAIFQRWLKKDASRPQDLRVLIDAANGRREKKVIQGVSGVCGDAMDIRGGSDLQYFQEIGLIKPVTQTAGELGYDVGTTWQAVRPLIAMPVIQNDGTRKQEQFLYPCNVSVRMIWVDYNQFDELGIERPPHRWDWDTFERIGRAFVQKANQGSSKQRRFLLPNLNTENLYRSLGLACFNETLTFCQLDDERYVTSLKKKVQWINEDHLLPTASEASGFDVESGYGGPQIYLFGQGNYAMFVMGRYSLIRLRQIQQDRLDQGQALMSLDVLEPPHGGFPNTTCHTRALGIYAGGQHIEQAKVFQSYLASEDYNMQIVRDADALPPNPHYTRTLAWEKPLPLLPAQTEMLFDYKDHEKSLLANFRIAFYEALDQLDRDSDCSVENLPRPPKPADMSEADYQQALAEFDKLYEASMPVYTSEWGMHQRFTELMEKVALPMDISPYCVPETVAIEIRKTEDEFINHLITAQQAAKRAANRVNDEILRTLNENPKLRPHYDRAMADQKIIDACKAKGQKIPVNLIQNPFYLRYYRVMDMLKDD